MVEETGKEKRVTNIHKYQALIVSWPSQEPCCYCEELRLREIRGFACSRTQQENGAIGNPTSMPVWLQSICHSHHAALLSPAGPGAKPLNMYFLNILTSHGREGTNFMETETTQKKLDKVQSVFIWPFPLGCTDLSPMAITTPKSAPGMAETDVKSPHSTEKEYTLHPFPRQLNETHLMSNYSLELP